MITSLFKNLILPGLQQQLESSKGGKRVGRNQREIKKGDLRLRLQDLNFWKFCRRNS